MNIRISNNYSSFVSLPKNKRVSAFNSSAVPPDLVLGNLGARTIPAFGLLTLASLPIIFIYNLIFKPMINSIIKGLYLLKEAYKKNSPELA